MADDKPDVIMVPVKRHDVSLSIEDIMTPLTAFARQTHVGQAVSASSVMQQHAANLSGLAQQVLDVAKQIDLINPGILSPRPPKTP